MFVSGRPAHELVRGIAVNEHEVLRHVSGGDSDLLLLNKRFTHQPCYYDLLYVYHPGPSPCRREKFCSVCIARTVSTEEMFANVDRAVCTDPIRQGRL